MKSTSRLYDPRSTREIRFATPRSLAPLSFDFPRVRELACCLQLIQRIDVALDIRGPGEFAPPLGWSSLFGLVAVEGLINIECMLILSIITFFKV